VQPFGASAISQVLDAFKDLGFRFATQAGITISKNDVVVRRPSRRSSPSTSSACRNLQEQYEDGLITQEERHLAVTDQWNAATDEVADAMIENIKTTDQLNSIYMMATPAPVARSSRSASWPACAA
jgi:DNA-directed RNA polymerase subunit beta'